MSLPNGQDLQQALRVESDVELALMDAYIASATAQVARYVQCPLAATARTYIDEASTLRAYDKVTRLQLPEWPFQTTGLTVTDNDGAVMDPTTYRLAPQWGQIIANYGVAFDNGPYTIDVTVGLATHPDYATIIEPVLRAAILDLAADLFQRRNPNAVTEAAGGGVSVTYLGTAGLPPRVCALLDTITAPRVSSI